MPAQRCRLGAGPATALGLLAGVVADHLLGDPRRGHPVALFGAAAGLLERRMWHDDAWDGAAFALVTVGSATTLGLVAQPRDGLSRAVVTAAATWAVLGGRSLAAEAHAVGSLLSIGDLPGARRRVTHLVGRRTDRLDEGEIVRATVESVAENTCDAVVAPLFWGALGGVPALLGYRALNTLDAMVGHRSPRHRRFGWASARGDDLANYVPARLTVALTALAAPAVGGDARAAVAVARRDGRRHPSPNSGRSEAAFAGALAVRLGGRNDYGSMVEDRPLLGAEGAAPDVHDIERAARLSRGVTLAAAAGSAALATWCRRRPGRKARS
ncbi:MAG: cobalamin biosynthesis protein [Dermatophilaceae bacterium]